MLPATQTDAAGAPDLAPRLAGMTAVLSLVLLSALLLVVVLLVGRHTRRLVRQQRHQGPSGRVGPSDWDPRPWSEPRGGGHPPESDTAEGDSSDD
ncbi:MAG: hypothetical protein WDZ59_16335 [Pirellulales bacterium]